MFRLSKAAEYSIRGVLHLSKKPKGATSDIDEIAKDQHVPASYLAKLFQTLARKGFIQSFRGPDGGFALSKEPAEITLLQVIESVEGPICLNYCLLRVGACSRDKVCPVHDVWSEAQKRFLDLLSKVTFEDLVKSSEEKLLTGCGKTEPGKKSKVVLPDCETNKLSDL